MKWSKEVWNEIVPIYKEILELPFIKELTAGTLPEEKFLFYLQQDSIYLGSYMQVLAHIASRMPIEECRGKLLGFAVNGIDVEKAIHGEFLSGKVSGKAKQSPTCLLYTSYLKSQAYASVEVEMASVLPCFWVYQRVGEDILANTSPENHPHSSLETNPYRKWIETYADKQFAESTQEAIAICDRLASDTSEENRKAMTEAFVMATKMELMFWDSAYKLEKWRI